MKQKGNVNSTELQLLLLFLKIHFHISVFAGERWRVKGGGCELRYNRAAEGEQNKQKKNG